MVSSPVNDPAPLPAITLLSLVAGLAEVFQQTPLDLMEAPPSSVMFPPEVAVVRVIPVTLSVVRTGRLSLLLQAMKNTNDPAKTIIRVNKTLVFETISVFTIFKFYRIQHDRPYLVH